MGGCLPLSLLGMRSRILAGLRRALLSFDQKKRLIT
jgi:hypothetical protein